MSEITPRNPITSYIFDGIQAGVGHKYLFETTVAKRILSIMPKYAMAEPPIIADVDANGDIILDSQFVTDVKRIMESRRGTSTNSPSIFNGNFGGFEKITEADILSYGRWGGIYLVFDDDDPTSDASKNGPKKLIGMQPLDESQLIFEKPSKGFNIEQYTVKIETQAIGCAAQTINNVHHSRIVRITDNDGFEHVPRLTNIEMEVRNLQDLMLSMMASIAISRPKISTVIDTNTTELWLNQAGETLASLLDTFNKALESVISSDQNVMVSIGATNPEFVQPSLIEISPALLSVADSISAKTGIPSLIILGSEVGSLASSKDKENFLDGVKQYRTQHTRSIIRQVISRLINARAVAWPSNTDLEFDIFWSEDKSEITQTNIKNIMDINSILTNNNLNDETKVKLINLAEKLASEME